MAGRLKITDTSPSRHSVEGWHRRGEDDAGVDDDILDLQRTFDDAELQADTRRLDALLVDDFLSIGERGFVLDKQQWITRHKDFRYLSLETSEVDVRRYEHTAILRCVQHSRATWRGDAMTLATRVSQVWVEQPAGWRLAAIQFSTLAPS